MVCPLKSIFGPLIQIGLPEEAIVDRRTTDVDLSFYTPTDLGGQDDMPHNTSVLYYRRAAE